MKDFILICKNFAIKGILIFFAVSVGIGNEKFGKSVFYIRAFFMALAVASLAYQWFYDKGMLFIMLLFALFIILIKWAFELLEWIAKQAAKLWIFLSNWINAPKRILMLENEIIQLENTIYNFDENYMTGEEHEYLKEHIAAVIDEMKALETSRDELCKRNNALLDDNRIFEEYCYTLEAFIIMKLWGRIPH